MSARKVRQRYRDERPASQQIENAAQGWARMFAAPGYCNADAEELRSYQTRWFRRLRRLLTQGVFSPSVAALLRKETGWDGDAGFGDESALIAGLILVLAHNKAGGMFYHVFELLLAGHNPDKPNEDGGNDAAV